MSAKPKLLFLVAEDWYFCSHRLSLALAASEAGYEVIVVTRVNQHAETILAAGLTLVPLQRMRRAGVRPLQELTSLGELWSIYRRERPDLVHHVGLKPVVYGSLVAHIVGVRGIVNALAGLGFVFSSGRLFARLLRPVVKFVFSCLLNRKNARVIVQNESDRDVLTNQVGIDSSNVCLIRGAGVDLRLYSVQPPSVQPPLIVLIARMLWDKGVGDFVEAADRIRDAGVQARFALIGIPDPENPTSVPESQLCAWHDGGKIEWWGYRSDIPAVLTMASIACLPTFYGEGVPKALIEAMASSRVIVTTDIPGCRELVTGGRSGILVPPRDVPALSAALESLILDPDRCRQMGAAGRLMVEQSLSLQQVLKETLSLYAGLVPTKVA
ncbi:glycosyltransferase family 4 protein [Laribacter hongkongensis]|uniref:glycosyltransferase family 4 protein n=1 Tax=Laribacter hongkongensis TaxID=168471 RepID=UPI001EFDABF8|nr:glycosyltransferase family 4 protein [Laribacter hongkongensis]MCG9095340.1 glycosyltransferase family 4 protein [Laribacter hongkongensis]